MSKFAYHVLQRTDWLQGRVQSAPFRWIKLLDPPIGDPFPGLKTIGRIFIPDNETNALISQREAGAVAWYARVRAAMLERSWVYVWELPNEPVVDTAEQRQALAAFTQRAVGLMHLEGLRAAVGCFARGTPQLKAADPSSTALQDLRPLYETGDYLALHEYGVVPMDKDAAWHCLRHRLLLQELRAMGIQPKPILITEAGIDAPGGWKSQHVSEDAYWAQLLWYDGELQKDPEVLCWTPYTVGPTHDWSEFEITPELARRMAAEVQAHPPQKEAPPVSPIKSPPMQIDARCMQIDEFVHYVEGLEFPAPKPTTLYIHHTSVPGKADWRGKDSLLAMKADFERRLWKDAQGVEHEGWTVGPHLFVAEDGIWLFTDLRQDGAGVIGHNAQSRHLEMVGNYSQEQPSGATLRNTIAALGILCVRLGLGPTTRIHFHRDDEQTECPGKAVTKTWLIPQIKSWVDNYKSPPQGDVEGDLRNWAYNAMRPIPANGFAYNPTFAFPSYATAHNLGCRVPLASDPECGGDGKAVIAGQTLSVAAYALGIVYCLGEDWAHVKHIAW